jgi:hypothetical protein
VRQTPTYLIQRNAPRRSIIFDCSKMPREDRMTALIPRRRRPVIVNVVARWWRNWTRARCNQFDLQDCNADEVKRIAQHLGISAAELRFIASYDPDRADLLRRRMAALHLEPGELARCEPITFRELQRRCTTCDSRGRCALDLADEFAGPTWQAWRDYCPNATTLSMLSTLQCCPSGVGRSRTTQ